jgi:phage FluMu protein Com
MRMGGKMSEIRCSNCHALLLKADIKHGKAQVKCKCGTLNTIDIQPDGRSFQERLNLTTKSRSV